MTEQELKKANIDNLTSLWRAMGSISREVNGCTLHASTSWPHRCWFDWDCNSEAITGAEDIPDLMEPGRMMPVWQSSSTAPGKVEQALIDQGMPMVLEQTAMYLPLPSETGRTYPKSRISIADSAEDAALWARVSGEAFGYEIDEQVIHAVRADSNATLFLYHEEGQAAGTALLYRTGEAVGVHQVGVPQAFQGRGIGKALMLHALAAAGKEGAAVMTLQASSAGRGLYERLGFTPQFTIRSYRCC